jgi:hypothetical protein
MSKIAKRRLVDWAWYALVAAIAVVMTWTFVQVLQLQEQSDALVAALDSEQQNIVEEGGTPVAPAPEEIIEDPEAEPPPAGPSREELNAAVEAAVEAYFLENPLPENATPAEIAAGIASAVADYVTSNPEAVQPSQEQLNAAVEVAVAAYLTQHPPADGKDGADGHDGAAIEGPQGPQGEPGPAPTFDELVAAVQAHIAENPLPTCPPGTTAEARTLLVTDGPPAEAVVCIVQAE